MAFKGKHEKRVMVERPKEERKGSFRDERLRHKTAIHKAKEKNVRGLSEKSQVQMRKYDTIDTAIRNAQAVGQGVNATSAVSQGGNSNQILSQTGLNPANGSGGGNIG